MNTILILSETDLNRVRNRFASTLTVDIKQRYSEYYSGDYLLFALNGVFVQVQRNCDSPALDEPIYDVAQPDQVIVKIGQLEPSAFSPALDGWIQTIIKE